VKLFQRFNRRFECTTTIRHRRAYISTDGKFITNRSHGWGSTLSGKHWYPLVRGASRWLDTQGGSNIVFPSAKTSNASRNAGGDGVVGTSLHRFLLRFRLRWVTSGTSVGTSTGSDGSGALACRLEWRSIHTQNPKQTAVMASTATVAGSIVFSSCFDSPRAALLFTTSSVRRREGTFLDHSSFHLAPFVRYRAIAPFGQLETSFLSIREFRSMMPSWNG